MQSFTNKELRKLRHDVNGKFSSINMGIGVILDKNIDDERKEKFGAKLLNRMEEFRGDLDLMLDLLKRYSEEQSK